MKTIGQLIHEFESASEPENIKVRYKSFEFEVYPWLKPAIFSAIQQGKVTNSGNKSKRFQLLQLFSGCKYLFKNPNTLILSNSLERRQLNDGVYDKLFHSIAQVDQYQDCITIEAKFPSNSFPRSKYADKRCASRSIFYLKEMLLAKILGKIEVVGTESLQKFLSEYKLNIDIESIIKRNIAQFIVFRRFLKRRKKIQRVFLSAAYTNFGVVNACKALDISVIEVQHGVINSEHYGYNYNYAPTKDQFPEFLLTTGKADETFILSNKISKYIKPVAIGSFILDHYRKLSTEMKEKNSVAVSLQDCSTGEEAYHTFIELAIRLPDIHFHFKRRRLSLDHYKQISKIPSNVTFEEERDVYALICACNLHMTAYSSCALEAPALGRRNILYDLNGKARQYYSQKLPEGPSTRYASNLEDLCTIIPEMIKADIKEKDIRESNAANVLANYEQNLSDFVNMSNK